MNKVIPEGHEPSKALACSTIMSLSSYAVRSGLEFIGWALLGWGFSLRFKLIELIGQQNATSWRAYSHVDIALPQELLCLLQRFSSRGTANIDPRKFVVPADQELQPRRANHARQPPQRPEAKETVVRLQVERSSRSGDAETMRAPLSLRRERSLPSVTDKCRRGSAVIIHATLIFRV